MKLLTIPTLLLALMPLTASAQAKQADAGAVVMEQTLKQLYPNTKFERVRETPVETLYEVQMGQNLAYVHKDGRYWLFGALYDMQEQTDLSAESREQAEKLSFDELPFEQAIKIVKGSGARKFALFSDPDCPFCKRLEETLSGMTDYTVYVFLFPLQSIHPGAVAKAEHIWCSKSPAKAWHDYMLLDQQPPVRQCKNPIDANIRLAGKLGIHGTPGMIHMDGRKTAGAMPRAQLERWLNGDKP